MPFPFIPVALGGGILFSLLFKSKPPSTETAPISPVIPGQPPPPPPPAPQPLPVVPPKVPGVASPENMFVVDAPSGLRVHSTPEPGVGNTIASAPNGSVVTVLEFDVNAPPPPENSDDAELFGWARIRVREGVEGFVARRYLSSSGASGTKELKEQLKNQRLSEKEIPIEPAIDREPRAATRQINTPEGPITIPVVLLTPEQQAVIDAVQEQGISVLTPDQRRILDSLSRGVNVDIAGVGRRYGRHPYSPFYHRLTPAQIRMMQQRSRLR